MKSRERILAMVVGAVVVLLVLNAVVQQVIGAFSTRENQRATLQAEIEKKQKTIDAGRLADNQIRKWQHSSLPKDSQQARSLYNDWLVSLAKKLDGSGVEFRPTTRAAVGSYESYGFQVKGDSDLALNKLVGFLHGFYSTNQLQQIKNLTLKPKPETKEVGVIIDIEALQIPGADRTDKLNLEKTDRLKLADLAAYENVIGNRSLFADYTPPPPVRVPRDPVGPKPTPKFDVAKFATITGIVEADDKPQLWIRIKTTGDQLKLSEGDDFKVGDEECKVISIGTRDAVVSVAGKNKKVHLEDNLRDAAEVPDDSL